MALYDTLLGFCGSIMPQPPIPEPDAACDPHRGKPTRKRGAATHDPLCDAKLKEQGALAEKTLGKARGVDTHPPRAPPGQQSGDHFDARRAPSARASSFAQAIDG